MTRLGREYYRSHTPEIMAQFEVHAGAWKPFIAARFGEDFAEVVVREAREAYIALIPEIPYIGGDANPMTRHLVRSTTSLIFYKVMQTHGKTPEEAGHILYQAVAASVSRLPPQPCQELTAEFLNGLKERARCSQERRYAEDWVDAFVPGDGIAFDYGLDFLECGTQKLYHAHAADEFLPFYCYLDFVTHRMTGWGFSRARTLSEGHDRCEFRWKKGSETAKGWPPPFLTHGGS